MKASKSGVDCMIKDSEIFLPQTNGEISDSIVQNWTLQAYECYSIRCNCKMCYINRAKYSFVCQMPKIIKALLKKQGKPNLRMIQEQNKTALIA